MLITQLKLCGYCHFKAKDWMLLKPNTVIRMAKTKHLSPNSTWRQLHDFFAPKCKSVTFSFPPYTNNNNNREPSDRAGKIGSSDAWDMWILSSG